MFVFKMHTREGEKHEFTYTGNMRYSPNNSSVCGNGSDDWMYLCEEDGKECLLMFSDSAEFGCSWICYVLSSEKHIDLTKENVNVWFATMREYAQSKTYTLRLDNIDEVRSVLPKVSRCTGKLQDEHFI